MPVAFEISFQHKKVLLRERKRHTDRHIASPSVVLVWGVPPIWTWPGGVTHPWQGVPRIPPSGPGWGTPCPRLDGVPPSGPGLGTSPPIQGWMGYSPPSGPGRRTPTPSPGVDKLKTLPSLILRMRLVINASR